jgi:hypothetical protein
MRSSIFLTLASTLITVLAQNISETSVVDQSANFNLVIQSKNKTLDGKFLGACHDGAAFEGLCAVGGVDSHNNYVSFQFNTTRYICTETNSTGTFTIPCTGDPVDPALQTGLITWWLPFNDNQRVSQAFFLEYVPWSNVAMTQIEFGPYEGSGTYVAFDKKGLLNILQYQDDRLEPGNEYLPKPRPLYNWYICNTYWSGYSYVTLTWVLGGGAPQNPTCQKVNIKRVFV